MKHMKEQIMSEINEQILFLLHPEKETPFIDMERYSEPFCSTRLKLMEQIEPLDEGFLLINKTP